MFLKGDDTELQSWRGKEKKRIPQAVEAAYLKAWELWK